MNRFLLCVTIALLFLAQGLVCQWSNDSTVNLAIGVEAGDQILSSMLSDGNGGALLLWEDHRSGNADVYAQLVNASGVAKWTANGLVVCNAANDQSGAVAASDGSGGFIITWVDLRSDASGDIYGQRLDANGTALWTTNGVAISAAAGSQYGPTIVLDGNGGAIIAWRDYRGVYSDAYAQRINGSGVVQWTTDGVRLCPTTGTQDFPIIISDGKSGAIIAWGDSRNYNENIYAQRIDSNGVNRWTTNGVAVYTGSPQQNPVMTTDGNSGAILVWQDHRGSDYDVYSQRVDSSGVVQWTASGIPVCTASGDQTSPVLTSDGSGGAIIAWPDGRAVYSLVYAQHVNSSGAIQWASNGKSVCPIPLVGQGFPSVVGDGTGEAVVTWSEGGRHGNGNLEIYAQRLDGSGALLWPAWGEPVCTATGNQFYPSAISDGSGGAIVAWRDTRSPPGYDLYAQRINSGGVLPVELVSFSAHAKASEVTLFWATASEVNNYGFEVERMPMNDEQSTINSWTKAGFVEGAGSSATPKSYSFIDRVASQGTYHYRLKQIDRDGAFKYSAKVQIEVGVAPKIFSLAQNYPNPFNPSTSIRYILANRSHVKIVITNTLGEEVAVLANKEQETGYHVVEWQANVSSGVYFYRLEAVDVTNPNNRFMQVKKMVLLR